MVFDLLDFIYDNVLTFGLFGLLLATLLSMYFVPALRELAMANNFTDTPSARKSHSLQVPILGGVAIYFSTFCTIATFTFLFDNLTLSNTSFLLAFGSITLLVVGVLDDVFGLKPLTKLIFQISIAVIVVYTLQFNIENMNGLLGLFALPKIISLILSLFIYIIFMNMLNLIDGIDGLASGLSMIAFTFFAYVTYNTGSYFNLLLCVSCIGSLLPFMYFNLFSDKKIFLGDNGSLILGFTLGFLTLELLSLDNSISVFGVNTPLMLMSLFSFPLVDTLRVFTIRILRNRSPFSPDKNHVHHHLLRLGLSHRHATLIILVYTVLITLLSFFLLEVNINIAFVVLFTIAVSCILLPTFLQNKTDGSLQFINRN